MKSWRKTKTIILAATMSAVGPGAMLNPFDQISQSLLLSACAANENSPASTASTTAASSKTGTPTGSATSVPTAPGTTSSSSPATVAPSAAIFESTINVPATNRVDAMMRARLNAGRIDPFALPALTIKPLSESSAAFKQPKPLPKLHLPPPPTDSSLAPPPPPTETITTMPGEAAQSVGQAGQLASVSALPDPPEKPLISETMKLVGVLADKAFFTFTDLSVRRANKFPATVVLSNGEQFESVHLVSVAPNSVVLEEDGERVTKELERIR